MLVNYNLICLHSLPEYFTWTQVLLYETFW